MLRLTIGPRQFLARIESEKAPATCAAVSSLLPLRGRILQARWSGEALWIPLGNRKTSLERENALSRAVTGQLLFYPGDVSETEILLPYGLTDFACKYGELAGNHFATIVDAGLEWQDFGEHVWWHGRAGYHDRRSLAHRRSVSLGLRGPLLPPYFAISR